MPQTPSRIALFKRWVAFRKQFIALRAFIFRRALGLQLFGLKNVVFADLRQQFCDQEIVELTALIAFQNMSSKFNAALGVPAQGMENFSADAASNGFDTVGSGLYTTTDLYDQYLQCAQQTLDIALTASPSKPPIKEASWNAKEWANRKTALAAFRNCAASSNRADV